MLIEAFIEAKNKNKTKLVKISEIIEEESNK
jgi:hypothetical protein